MNRLILSFVILLFALTVGAQEEKLEMAKGLIEYHDLFNATENENVACYRIPAIVTASNGDLIAAIDERVPSCGDLKWSKDINIVIRRSADNGKTWTDIEMIVDFPEGQSASDPSMIVNGKTKEIFLFYNYMNLDKERDVYYLHYVKSSNNGRTWSESVDITSQIAKPEWHKDFKFITSGRGIYTGTGKMLHCMVNLNSGLHVFGSNDDGKTWYFIDTPVQPANESKIIELVDGSWMINSRANDTGMRYVHVSNDEGLSWKSRPEPALIDPGCNGSIIRYTSTKDGYKKNRLLFSNAKMEKGRKNMTVRLSYDEGQTWTEGKTIYPGGSAYSDLTILENGDIGLFFEKDGHKENPFLRFTLDWLSDGKDKLEKPTSFSSKLFNYPILKEKEVNPFMRIEIENYLPNKTLESVMIDLGANVKAKFKSIRLYSTRKDSLFNANHVVATNSEISKKVKLINDYQLEKGLRYFWLACELGDEAVLTDIFSPSIKNILIDGIKLKPSKATGINELRFGVAVRQHKQDNVHTYRIPGLATTNDGTLLAIYDVRREGGRDLQGHMDIGVSRSIDGGNNWEPMRIVLDMGEWGGLPEKFNGVSDANILVDKNSGDIYLAGLWMHGVIDTEGVWHGDNLTEESREWNHQWRNKGSQPGFGVKETSQFLITQSTDDGQTWSKPVNLTQMCKKEEWWLWAPAPGQGITLENGILVIPTQGRDKSGETFSNITYSKDSGMTWITSNPAYHNTTESMAVQLADGSIMLNMRDNRNRQEKGAKNGRAITITKDLGESWIEHSTSHGALIESVCMASIHKHEFTNKKGEEKSVLFFSNPNSKHARHKQTIKVSFDDGLTWPEKYWIELDEGLGAGYSCLTSIDKNTLGIIYEGSQAHMTFQSIDLSEILKE